MKIYVKKVDGIITPKRGSDKASGYDIIATSDPEIIGSKNLNDDTKWDRIDYILYKTNLFIAPEIVTVDTLIFPRSSISNNNLMLANSIGLVDCFSENSLIKTEVGDKTIGKLMLQDVVYSANDKLEIERDFVSSIVNLGESEILKIETEDGILEITPGTMIYTEIGIRRADELKENDKILHF